MQIVTISTDHPEEIRDGRHEHGLQAIMLADPQLEVTDAFGLRNQLFKSAPPGDDAPGLPVPTSLLLNREGRVLWIDKATDYQRRSPPEVVLEAMKTYLD